MNQPIYLDYAATTPVDPRVAEVMAGCLTFDGVFANPASRSHIYGWQAEEQVEMARRNVADLLACDPREIVWTSGATEANNLALKGVFEVLGHQGQMITSISEHKAVVDPVLWLEKQGVEVMWLRPNTEGRITVEQILGALTEHTRLVSVMHVNNETGVVNPVAEIGRICRERGILFHVDAAQSAGKLDIDVTQLNADLVSLSAHKFYGPKGVGCLYVRRAVHSQLAPIIHGGGHERGLRSGTLPTHQLVGMGEAARIARESLTKDMALIARLRDRLWQGISDLPGVKRNGDVQPLSPIHLNVSFGGTDSEMLLISLRELAVSSGSACTSASVEPSYVLKAMGISDADALSSVRLSLGRFTTATDIDRAIAHIREMIPKLLGL